MSDFLRSAWHLLSASTALLIAVMTFWTVVSSWREMGRDEAPRAFWLVVAFLFLMIAWWLI